MISILQIKETNEFSLPVTMTIFSTLGGELKHLRLDVACLSFHAVSNLAHANTR
jgi:hypothetical protein